MPEDATRRAAETDRILREDLVREFGDSKLSPWTAALMRDRVKALTLIMQQLLEQPEDEDEG